MKITLPKGSNINMRLNRPPSGAQPDITFVMPCYNEMDSIRSAVGELLDAFWEKNVDVELVLVDNGSLDETGKIIDQFIEEGLPVIKATVEVNQGYGNGVLCGLPYVRSNLVGIICADNQVTAEDVVRLYEVASKAHTPKAFKVRRRFRMEGPLRRIISITYNIVATALFGDLNTTDINASPKILPREYLEWMNLRSKDWFLDAEIMIKAKQMGLGVFELNVFAQMRAEGASNVRPSTCWEFIVNLLKYRFGKQADLLAVKPLNIDERMKDDALQGYRAAEGNQERSRK